MKPQLPTRPTRDPDRISATWLQRLLDCVAWAMDHPKADGRTLCQDGGVLRALPGVGDGRPGGAPLVWVQLTGLHPDSPTTGERRFRARLWRIGNTRSTPDATDVTVAIRNTSWAGPPDGVFTTLPTFTATPASNTWTGASATVISETVYWITDPFRWY